ncbi:hypothetical protein HMPREF9946_01337 [Acetobacteraceae bacterium AT-5844]|nr:hypothetical protein HMPREF9946_01337 [Acetobacteraceae bacterium AT-5844]
MAPAAPAQPAGFAEQQEGYAPEAPSPEEMPASMAAQYSGAEAQRAPAAGRPVAAPAPVSEPASFGSLFRRATGLMRRTLPEAEMPPQAAPRAAAPQAQPVAQPQPQAARPAQAPAPEEEGLDIPTFLRRQSN